MSVVDEDIQWRNTQHEDSWFEYTGYFADNDDWYPEYEDDDGYREDFYTDDNDPWAYDADDEGWPYPDEDDETEAPF